MSTADKTRAIGEREYTGNGQRHAKPLPESWEQPEPYVAPADLRDAVNTALFLRRPLLLEGEPGTGKTRLAHAIAYELGFPLKEVYIRSTSRAQDLLWTFDAVGRLYDVQKGTPKNDEQYVRLGELGKAIELSTKDCPCVVLIDEIDKADLDFPNDLLLVLDRLKFQVDEVPTMKFDALGGTSAVERRPFLPLVLITSNREKELPAPFLRRCLFYSIPFPNEAELASILKKHFTQEPTPLFVAALQRFRELRDPKRFSWRKAPSTSELLDWVRLLENDERRKKLKVAGVREAPLDKLPHLQALLKTASDNDELRARLEIERNALKAGPAAAAKA